LTCLPRRCDQSFLSTSVIFDRSEREREVDLVFCAILPPTPPSPARRGEGSEEANERAVTRELNRPQASQPTYYYPQYGYR
jgi:hypothetical protein